ncbi:polysaccharide deacetylase family protein [Actinorhabdospora filicis]|nr:polysaccharide deacetylase family protein [Actinorhabdospora filicis]
MHPPAAASSDRSSDAPPPPPTSAPASPSPSPSASSPDDGKHQDDPSKIKSDNPLDRVIYTTGSNAVALTFDDGPDPNWTPKVLGKLREYGVKATFCLVGKNADAYPELVQEIVRDGHTLCNHSWSHDLELGKKSREEIRKDMQKTNDAIHRAVPGEDIAYFRHPGGNWTNNAIDIASELGMKSLNWNVDPKDWEKPSAKKIADRVITNTKVGSIVLLHDAGGDRTNSYNALDRILKELGDRFKLIPLRH